MENGPPSASNAERVEGLRKGRYRVKPRGRKHQKKQKRCYKKGRNKDRKRDTNERVVEIAVKQLGDAE